MSLKKLGLDYVDLYLIHNPKVGVSVALRDRCFCWRSPLLRHSHSHPLPLDRAASVGVNSVACL